MCCYFVKLKPVIFLKYIFIHTVFKYVYCYLQNVVYTWCSLWYLKMVSLFTLSHLTVTLRLLFILDMAIFQKEQLHFSQCLTATLSTLSSQLVAALSGQYNPERHFNSNNSDASANWLEQLAYIGLLVKFEVLLMPDRVSDITVAFL